MSDLVIIAEEAKALGGGLNGFREAIQRYILRTLAAAGFFEEIAFVGDTALRISHGLNRYSEDLDFAALHPISTDRTIEIGDTAFEALKKLKLSLSARRDLRTIEMGGPIDKLDYICQLEVKLPATFRETKADAFNLRIDLDRNPAGGWRQEPILVRSKSRPFALRMHDRPSLFAGKLHVLCCREDRAKGRDFFDLAWYLSQGIAPNLTFLDSTIQALEAKPWPASEWKTQLLKRLETVNFDRLRRDIEPFLIDPQDAMLIDRELLMATLQ
jgi:hypothetical protein